MENNDFIKPSGHSHSFDTGVAKNLGLTASVVFNHIVYWLRINSCKGINVIEDKVWMYESQQEIANFLDYLTLDEVKKSIVKLLDAGILIKNNFNRNPFDKRNWYTTSDQSIIQKSITKEPYGSIDRARRLDPRSPMAPSLYEQQEQHKDKEPSLTHPIKKEPVEHPKLDKREGFFEEEWQFLKPVEINLKDKLRLMKSYSPDLVKKILDMVMSPDFVIKKTLSCAIFYYAKRPNELPDKKPEIKEGKNVDDYERVLLNQQDAIKFANEYLKSPENPCVSHGGGYIEFRHLRGLKLEFSDKNFTHKFDESIKSYRAYLAKLEKTKEKPKK